MYKICAREYLYTTCRNTCFVGRRGAMDMMHCKGVYGYLVRAGTYSADPFVLYILRPTHIPRTTTFITRNDIRDTYP